MTGPQQGGPQGFDPTQRPAGSPPAGPPPAGSSPAPGQPAPGGPGAPGGYAPPRPGSAYQPGAAAPGQRPQPHFPPQYGQQGYPPPGYGGYGPYSYPPPARPRRTGLIVGIVVGVLVLIGAGVTTWLLLSGGGDDPEDVAGDYVAAMQSGDTAGIRELLCATDQAGFDQDPSYAQQVQQIGAGGITVTLGTVTENGNSATATISFAGNGQTGSSSLPLMKNENDNWLVCESGVLTSADQDR